MYPIQLSSEGEVNKGGNKGIYLALFTDSEGDRCFSIYQTSWIKLKKVNFCKLQTSLGRDFVHNLRTFRGFCPVHFTILLQIQYENNFLPTSEHRQTKFVAFLVFVCTNASFIIQISSSENVSKRDAINGSCRKTVNSQGYSKLREPIETRENCCSLIW